MGKKKEHEWAYMGITKGGEEIGQCQHPTCRKWRIGVNSKTYKTMSDKRYQQMIKEGLITGV